MYSNLFYSLFSAQFCDKTVKIRKSGLRAKIITICMSARGPSEKLISRFIKREMPTLKTIPTQSINSWFKAVWLVILMPFKKVFFSI